MREITLSSKDNSSFVKMNINITKMNDVVEATNKNINKIIQKMVKTYKDWHKMLPFAMYSYRVPVRTSTRETPFSLVYGLEVVILIKVYVPSLRVS